MDMDMASEQALSFHGWVTIVVAAVDYWRSDRALSQGSRKQDGAVLMHTMGRCHFLRAGDENEPQTLWIGEELVEKCAGESTRCARR
jgi:hypothetical protein